MNTFTFTTIDTAISLIVNSPKKGMTVTVAGSTIRVLKVKPLSIEIITANGQRQVYERS